MTNATTSTPTKRRHAAPPIRNLGPPKLKLPPGACDTHFHFLGPQREIIRSRRLASQKLTVESRYLLNWALNSAC
jgi:hypothetical protein